MTETPGSEQIDPTPAEIHAQSLGQLAEFIQQAAEGDVFEHENAKNNALLSSMAMVGLVPNLIAGDYVEAQRCLAEIMGPLFDAMAIPRERQPAFAAGMIAGILKDKEPKIVQAGPQEVSAYGRSLFNNGKRKKQRR